MIKIQKNMKIIGFCSAATMIAAPSCFAANLINSGDINVAANWDTGVLPGTGEIGTVAIDAAWPNASGAGTLAITGDLVIGSTTATNINLTAAIDIVGSNPSSVTFNNVTVTVADDIFTGGAGGNFIFNSGSITSVNDDFEANGGSTTNNSFITVNGGVHSVGDQFGAQRGSVLNFLGGTVTSARFRTDAGNVGTPVGGTINIGGSAVLDADSASFAASGVVNFDSNWSGQLDVGDLGDLTAWFAVLDTGTLTFDGAALDEATFNANFEVDNGALRLAVPEPSSALLLALSGLFLARRSRK